MKRLLNHIHSKPDHIRELWAAGCTVVVALVVLTIWFQSFKHHTYALLNPDEQTQQDTQYFADTSGSLFGTIWHTLTDGKNQVANLLGGSSTPTTSGTSSQNSAHPLPLPKDR